MPPYIKTTCFALAFTFIAAPSFAAGDKTPSPMSLLLSEVGANSDMRVQARTVSARSNDLSIKHSVLKTRSGGKLTLRGKKFKKDKDIDHLHLALGQDMARWTELEKALTKAYGAPNTRRSRLKVWEMPNVDARNRQAKQTTVMLGQDKTGYFVIIDRRGPGKGNNPRLLKAKPAAQSPSPSAPLPFSTTTASTGRPAISDRG